MNVLAEQKKLLHSILNKDVTISPDHRTDTWILLMPNGGKDENIIVTIEIKNVAVYPVRRRVLGW